mmetsp:Transcript_11674/g.23944  ORF Transcript_11674/g.23944 Transcript_11674/m.23944 type:complete len:403 (-) Transcript_11674:236-1444(-)
MDSGHETFLQAKFIINDLGQRSKAVSGTGGIGHNIHGRFILLIVDSHDKHGGIRGRSRDDNLLGSTSHVLGSSLHLGEHSSGLNDIVHISISPFDVSRVHFTKDSDRLAIKHDSLVVVHTNSSWVLSMGGVKFHHVFHVVHRDERIIDSHNVDHRVVLGGTHDEASNTSETVNTNIDRFHGRSTVLAVDNISKFWLQRGASDEESINIFLGGQSRGSLGVGGSSVKNACVFGNVGAGDGSQVLTDGGMSVLCLFRGGGETSTDGPNGFVSDDDVGPVFLGEDIGVSLDLRENKVVGGSSFTAFQRFTTACDDLKTLIKSIFGLCGNFGVGFSLSTTFGMSNKSPGDSHIGQHIGRSLTSVSSTTSGPAILGTDGDITADTTLDRLKVNLGRADDNFGVSAQS